LFMAPMRFRSSLVFKKESRVRLYWPARGFRFE
jgi:hypothetical protein